MWRSSLGDVAAAQLQRHNAQARISSGRRIERVSDDPAGAQRAMEMTSEAAAIDQYRRAGEDAIRIVNAQDGALQSILDRLTRAQELTIAAGNSALDGEAREAAALQVEEIRDELVQLANSSQGGRSLFGGFEDVSVDDSGASVTLLADGGEVLRRISGDRVIQVNVDASEVFGFGAGRSVFDVLDDIIAETRSGDVASLSTTRTAELEQLRDGVDNGLGTVGARSVTIEQTLGDLSSRRDRLTGAVADIVDVDIAEATIAYSEANLAYEAALAVTAQVNRISLLDYL